MEKLTVLMLSLLLCTCSTSENREEETPREGPKNEDTTMSFVGVRDSLIREVIYKQADATADEMNDGECDFTEIYAHVRKDIRKADLAYIDQRSIVSGDALDISGYPTFNTPADITKSVADTGFDIVSTANNHCLNKYQEGIDCSHEIQAKQKGIITTGTYTSQKDRDAIHTIKRKGITSSFLAYTYGTNGIEPPNPYSVAYFDGDRIREDMKKAKQLSDVMTISAHWDDGNVSAPTKFQKKYAKLFADLGVDVVVGEHPHVTQPVTWMDSKDGNKTLVIYSLGNFLNGMLDVDNVLGGVIHFDSVKDTKSSEIPIQSVKWEPLVTHYTGDAADIMSTKKNFTVYKLGDYSEKLAERHRLNDVDGQKVRLDDLYARTKKVITEVPVIEKGNTK